MTQPMLEVTFRPLVDEDLPLLHRWLNDPAVVRWWEGEDVSWEAVVAGYGSANDDDVEHWLAHVHSRPVGWIQCYAAASEPEETDAWMTLGASPDAAGIDYLIGEESHRGTGLGSAMIAAFVRDVVFGRHPQWDQACAAPYTANVASCRALEKAGFRLLGAVDHSDEHGPDPDGDGSLWAVDRPGRRRLTD